MVYTPDGDAQGRQDFANRTSDFSVTSDGYQGVDPVTGINDTSQGRPYAYLPIAAGGTSFPYQIRFDGQQVENLRLSGETLAKIFTNQITNWDDPEITADNNGQAFRPCPSPRSCSRRARGPPSSSRRYFATEFPSIWQAYSGLSGGTEYYPRQGDQIAQNGSNSAMNYVASQRANGSISYVEYSFALSVELPGGQGAQQRRLLHAAHPVQRGRGPGGGADQHGPELAGLPPPEPDRRLHRPRPPDLSALVVRVHDRADRGRTRARRRKITTGKRQAIADFEYYSICQGQKEIGPIGYSPLPVNLVEAGVRPDPEAPAGRPGDRPRPSSTSLRATTRRSSRASRTRTTWPPSPPAAGLRPHRRRAVRRRGDAERHRGRHRPPPGTTRDGGATAPGSRRRPPVGGPDQPVAGATTAAAGRARHGSATTRRQPRGPRRAPAGRTSSATDAATVKPQFVSADAGRSGATSVRSGAAWPWCCCCSVFVVPVVIGYRRSRLRREAEQ